MYRPHTTRIAAARRSVAATGGTQALNLSFSGELMNNHVAATAVSAEQRIDVAQDTNGDAIFFSIGNDGHFYATPKTPGAPTGWQQYDLCASLGDGLTVQTFAVAQAADGTITLAVAASSASGACTVYVATGISNDPSVTSWSAFGAQWVARAAPSGSATVARILASPAAAGSAPLLIAAVSSGAPYAYALINADPTDTSWSWKEYPLPQDATSIVDLAVGVYAFGATAFQGTYALYQVGSSLALCFTTLPDQTGFSYNIPLTPPANAAGLATLPDAANNGATHLLVGAEGLYFYASTAQQRDAAGVLVPGTDALPPAKEILARQDADTIAAWLLDTSGNLSYVQAAQSDTGTWTAPVQSGTQVAQVAAQRNWTHLANELFTVGADNTLSYQYQDPATTLWKATQLPLFSTGAILELTTYTTHIAVEDAYGRPVASTTFGMYASQWTLATVNGAAVILGSDPDATVQVTTDATGVITVFYPVTTISTPIFHLTADFLDGVADVNPAAKLTAGLAQVQSADDLQNATTQDGQPVCDPSMATPNNLDAGAKALQQLVPLTNTLPDGSGTVDGGGSTPAAARSPVATLRARSAPSRSRIRIDRLPRDYCWGMSFCEGKARFHEGDDARRLVGLAPRGGTQALDDWGSAIKAAAGDVLRWIENAIDKVESFLLQVVDDALAFIVSIGGVLFAFTIEVLEQVYHVVHWVLEKTLGIDLDKFMGWLGFLFDWSDFVVTHRVMSNCLQQTALIASSQAQAAAGQAKSWFDGVRAKLQAALGIPGDGGSQNLPSTSGSTLTSPGDANDFRQSPPGNYASYHVQHGGVLQGSDDSTQTSPVYALFASVVEPALLDLDTSAVDIISVLKSAFDGGTLTAQQVADALAYDVLNGPLTAGEDVVTGLLSHAPDLISAILGILTEPIQIPFLSALYEEYVGAPFTLLDGLCLLLAIPTTVLYKIVTGAAPFANGTYGLDTVDSAGLLAVFQAAGGTSSALVAGDPPSSLSEAARIYSYVGAAFYSFGVVVNGAVSAVQALMAYSEQSGGSGTLRFLLRLQLVTQSAYILSGFPIDTGDEFANDFGIWVGDMLITAMTLLSYFAWGVEGPEAEKSSQCLAIYQLIDCLSDGVLYTLNLIDDLEGDDTSNVDAGLKFAQNALLVIGSGLAAGGALVAEDDPEAAAVELGFSVGADLAGAGFNVYRLVTSIENLQVHHNY